MSSFRFYAGGYHFSARKVRVESEFFMSGHFGEPQTEEITYLDELGVIAEKSLSLQFGPNSRIVLYKIQIKE
jgi:hypothetical protein